MSHLTWLCRLCYLLIAYSWLFPLASLFTLHFSWRLNISRRRAEMTVHSVYTWNHACLFSSDYKTLHQVSQELSCLLVIILVSMVSIRAPQASNFLVLTCIIEWGRLFQSFFSRSTHLSILDFSFMPGNDLSFHVTLLVL